MLNVLTEFILCIILWSSTGSNTVPLFAFPFFKVSK